MTLFEPNRMIEILAAFRIGQARRRPMDLQSDLVEGSEFVATCIGQKPSFFTMIDESESTSVFREAAELSEPELKWGTANIDVHHLYRPFQIGNAILKGEVERHARVIHPIFWATRDPALAERYRTGTSSELDDEVLLGYPHCCSSWHYEYFFARGIETACGVLTIGGRESQLLDLMSEGWRPEPGYFMPDELFLAAVLRSNIAYPHVSHVACPDCLSNPGSQSATHDRACRELARTIEPASLSTLSRWVDEQRWKVAQIEAQTPAIIEHFARERAASIREYEEYKRRARHLAKGLRTPSR